MEIKRTWKALNIALDSRGWRGAAVSRRLDAGISSGNCALPGNLSAKLGKFIVFAAEDTILQRSVSGAVLRRSALAAAQRRGRWRAVCIMRALSFHVSETRTA